MTLGRSDAHGLSIIYSASAAFRRPLRLRRGLGLGKRRPRLWSRPLTARSRRGCGPPTWGGKEPYQRRRAPKLGEVSRAARTP
jgi:hypothetical protein